ncbi:MAG: C39 family peptidase [Pseudobutyrivibrio sp.]|nr:C39 family peptidase [Pseudobutyrivibrio sp.]
MKKHYFLAGVIMILLLSVRGINASAQGVYENVDGDLAPDEDGYEDSCLQAEVSEESLKETDEEEVFHTLDSAQGFAMSLPVTHFKQETSYYCGPATTKQTIYYLGGGNYSQSTLAKELQTTSSGTVMGNIPTIINKHLPGKGYAMRTIPGNQSTYASQIYTALTSGKPVVIDIIASKSDGWPYNTNGHFLNISGVSCGTQGNYITVTDPNSSNAKDIYPLSTVYKVNSKHWNKAYIW